MPVIRQYDNPVDTLRPSETGIEAWASTGRHIEAEFARLGHAVGGAVTGVGAQIDAYNAHQEISRGANSFAGLFDDLTQQWNATAKAADPNDPTVATRFREEVLAPALDKFREGFATQAGQQWAQARSEHLQQHMFTKTAADMSTLAGDALVVNRQEMASRWSNAVYADPTGLDDALKSVDHTIGALVDTNPNITGLQAGKFKTEIAFNLKKQIAQAAFVGAVRSNPDEGLKLARDPKYADYLPGGEIDKLVKEAQSVRHAERIQASWEHAVAKQDRDEKSDDRETTIMQDLYSGDPARMSKVNAKAVWADDTLTRTAKERTVRLVERELKPETAAKVSNENYLGVLKDIRSGKIDNVDPIYAERTDGRLNRADFNQALKDLADFRGPDGGTLAKGRSEFFKRYAPTIDGAVGDGGIHSTLGLQKMYEAEQDARRQETALRTKGLDPNLVYDPRSEYFFGRPQNIAKYHVSLQDDQAYRTQIENARKASAQPKPREETISVGAPESISTIQTVKNAADYAKIKKGELYTDPNGVQRTKH